MRRWGVDNGKISELQRALCFADTGDDEMGRQGKDEIIFQVFHF